MDDDDDDDKLSQFLRKQFANGYKNKMRENYIISFFMFQFQFIQW